MTKDPDFVSVYEQGIDLYNTLASKVFNLPIEQCQDGSKPRKMMKIGLLATMYGISDFTLADQLGISKDEASKFIADFLTSYPVIKGVWTF